SMEDVEEETKEENISDKNYLSMIIGSKTIAVNGEEQSIDTAPVIKNGRTLLPIRAIIETFGGSVNWAANDKTTAITYGENVVTLTVNSTKAFVNNNETDIDAAPIIIDGRAFLPIRFVLENLGFAFDWNEETKTVTIVQEERPEYEITPIDDIFGLNMINPVSPKFTGVSFLNFITTSEETDGAPSLGVVTFEPCTRTDWHSHEGGQILLVTEGTGVLGMEGENAKLMLPGDVYYIKPGVKHFHSAADKSWFSHIALSVNPGTSTNWYEKVTDKEYMAAVAQAMLSSAGTHNNDETIFPKGETVTGDNFTGDVNSSVIVEHEDVFNCPVVRSWAIGENSSAKNLSGTDGKTVIAVLKGSGTLETVEGGEIIETGNLVIVEADTDYTIRTLDEKIEFISMNTKE
ncbi:MAG: cupin domain-containing protein, partial [Firmicutes bacterium]|nr:cupin domain-containing protein [Bacillota bacterium]